LISQPEPEEAQGHPLEWSVFEGRYML
jgi:hypothetical protein